MNKYNYDHAVFLVSKFINHTMPHSLIAGPFYRVQHSHVEKIISQYSPKPQSLLVDEVEQTKFPIWVFWGTGFDDAPEIVKICKQQMQETLFGEDLRFIDLNNLNEFLKLPEIIIRKYLDGRITLTHLSDIIRMGLLSKHGGIWIDATVLVLGDVFLKDAKNSFFTVSKNKTSDFNVAASRWTGFFIGGSDFRVAADFAYNFFIEYWKKNDFLVHYFLIDYVLDIAWKDNVGNFRSLIGSNTRSNSQMFSLVTALKNKETASIIQDGNTELFKLTYKSKINVDDLKKFISSYKFNVD